MKVYIAGRYPGLFDQAEEVLRAMGHDPVSPTQLDEAPESALRKITKRNISEMLGCEAVALLPGWRDSPGVKLEVATAEYVGMRVVEIPLELLDAE